MNRLSNFALVAALAAGTALAVPPPPPPPATAPPAAPPPPDATATKEMKEVLTSLQELGPKPIETLTPAQARTNPGAKQAVERVLQKQKKTPKPIEMLSVVDKKLTVTGGTIDVRVYTPEKSKEPLPAVVYFHGGGFVVADLDTYDASARALAKESKAVVISSHYRQAPEHAFPASHDDAVAAFRYVVAHPAEFNIDGTRVAVAGESAGGNLATVVAMRQKNDGLQLPTFQVLVYPFVTNDLTTPSHVKNGQGNHIIGNAGIAWFWEKELGKDWKTNKNPLVLPIYATTEQLKGLPPALVIVASLDPLMDEGMTYAKNLRAAGVDVTLTNYEGVTHEFFGMGAVLSEGRKANAEAGKALDKAFSEAKKNAKKKK